MSKDDLKKLEGELATHKEHIEQERESVAVESKQVEAASDQARQTIEELTAQRRELESGLSRVVLTNIRRLEDRRQGLFLSRAAEATCQSCFVRVRPQVFQEIKLATAVHSCGNCRRYLFFEPGILVAMGELAADSAAQSEGGIEAVNRGAV